jgi:general secretion pathway protein M
VTAAAQTVRGGVAQARERFEALQPRERWMLALGAAALLVTVLYLGVWEPLVKARAERSAALESSRQLALRLEQAAAQLQSGAGRNPAAASTRGLSLVAAVDQASKQGSIGKAPARIQPEGERVVRVWFEEIAFDALVRWLAEVQTRYGLSVQTLDVEPQAAPGQVNVRLSLTRGA